MNRVYRVVWNASIGAWVAVSENAKSKTKTKTVKVSAVAIAIASSAMMPVYADVLAGNNITVTPSGTDFVVATTDDVSLKKVTVGSVELDETTNTVKVGANTTLSTAGLNTDGSVNASILTITDSATIENGLTVANGPTALKDTSITGTLTTTGNTTVGGTLGVTGATTLNNTLNVVGNTTLSNVTTTGSASIGNGLTVANGTTALKNTNITGTLTTTGDTTVGGTLNVNGLAAFNNGAYLNSKKITGLAAGNISNASSTDAVNGGQLYTVNKNIADVLGTQLDANGTLQNPTYTVSDGKGGTQAFNNVRQAIEYITGVDTGTGTGGVGVGIKYFHTNSAAVDSQSKGLESVAIGPQAIANGTSSIAMGDQARADQENAVAIGKQSAAIGLNSTAIGSTTGTPRQPVYTRDANSKITAIDGMSVTTTGAGTNLTDITEINGVPVTNAQVTSLVALLSSGANLSLGKNSIALGTSNLARGESSVALGDSSKAVAKDAIAIGRNGNASGEQAISIGAAAQAAASGALAAGGASNAGRDGAVALGQGAFANTTAGISIGQNAGVGTSQGATNDRTDHIAIGRDSGKNVIGNRNIALGVGAGSNLSASGNGSSDDNIAIGVNAGSNLSGDDNIAIGRDANKNITAVAESVAIGSRVDATTGSTVLGYEAKASGGDYATVLGYKAKVTGGSGTALGRDSEASANNIALGASSVANGTSTAAAYLTADIKTDGYNIVSVGQTGQERRITNVAAGANLTDAVNVKQLHEMQNNVANLIGGQTGVDPVTGAFTGYIIELTDTKTNQTHQYTNVASAINAVSSGEISVLPGNAVMYNTQGGISNVAAGTKATDAVNLAQLNQAIADNGQHHVSINSTNPANENNVGATADESLAIGAGVTTSNAGVKSVVIGFDAATNAKESVAIGNTSTQANGDASIAIGKTALAKSTNNIAMGTNASSNGMESIVIGTNTQIDKTTGTSDYAVGIGSYSEVQNADQAIAIGRKAIVQGDNGTAIGHESLAAKENASALGNFAKATEVSANAIGNYATASGTSANAIGDNAKATAGNANAMGKSAEATSTSSNAIGDNAKATGVNANAMGTGAQALRQDTLALGTSAVASGLNASAIGKSADAAGLNANAFGNGAKAGAESSNAIGTGADVSATNGFALGTSTKVTHTNAIALGSGSISGNATPTASAIVNGKTYNYAGINPTSTVSVGSLGNERQIINVAAGRVSGSSTDAINGSQLFQTNEELANLANKTAQALGGGASANQATGAISAPSYTVTTNPAGTGTKTTVNNVGAALTALDTAVNQPLSFAGDTGAQISRKLGETLNVKGGATGTLAGNGNIGVVANGTNQLDIRLAETINLGGNGSVTTGSASIKNNEVKVGTNTLTDTGLKAGNVKVNTSTNDVTGLSNTTWNPAGTYNSGRAATEEQLLSAQNQLNTTLTDKGFSITAQSANSDKVKLGETVDFRNTDGNLVATRSVDNTINYDLAKNISVDKVTLGNIIIDKATGINAGNQKITGVTDGLVAAGSKDAVNGGQLDAVKAIANTGWKLTTDKTGTGAVAGNSVEQITPDETVTFIAGDNIAVEQAGNKVTVATKKDVVFDSVTAGGTVINNSGLSFVDGTGTLVANSPSISKTGINAGNQKITNVKAGDVNSTSTDAVNGSQLYTAQNNVKNVLGSSTQIDATGNLTSTNIGGVTGANTVHDAIDKVNSTATNAQTQANKGLNFAVNGVSPADNVQLGETVNFANGTNTTATYDAATNTYKYSLNDTLSLSNAGSLSIKDSAGTGTIVSVDKTGVQSGSIKLDASTGKITGVTDGLVAAGSKDAVNGGQLDAVKAIANTGWKLTTDKTGTGAVAGNSVEQITPDETVTFIAGDNIAVEQAGNKVTVATKKDVVFDSVTAGGTVINNSGLSFVDGTGTLVANSPSISKTGINAGNQKITNVKAGDVNSTSTDAVNGSQLYTAQNNVKNVLGSSTQIDATGNLTSTNIGGVTGANTVHDAIDKVNSTATNAQTQANKGLNFAVNGVSPADNVQLGETVNFANGTNTTATYDAATNTYKYSLNDTLSLSNAGSLSIKDSAGTGTIVSVDKTGVQSGSIKLDASTGKITGVTDGLVAAGSKDAVNGGQLDAVKAIANTGWKLTTDKTGTGAVAGNSVEQITPDETVTFIAGDNIAVEQAGNKVTVATKKDVVFDSVTAGGTVINNSGLSFVDGTGTLVANSPSISKTGINAGNQKITNVKAGDVNSTSTDAVNGSQLYTAQNNVKNVLGSSTQIDATGNLTSTNIGGVTGANTVHDAIDKVNSTATNAQTQANKGLNFAVNGVSPADNVQLGETVNFANGTNTTATYDAATNTYKYSLNDTLSLSNAGSLSIKDSAGTGTIVSVDKTGVQSGSIKLDASTGKITGVTDGLVAAGSKDAVNGGQLDAVKAIANTGWKLTTDKTGTGAVAGNSVEQITPDETVTFIAGDNIAVEQAGNKVTVATKKDVVFDSVTAGGTVINNAGLSFVDGTGTLVANSPSISKTGINAGNQKITNVKAGDVNSTSTDAVNGSQLYTAQNNVKNVLGSSTQIDAAGNLTSTNIGGVTGANTVHDAIQQVNNTATNAKTQADKGLNFAVNGVTPADNVQLGETVNFANGTNTTATYDAATNTYKYSLNDTLSLSNAGSLSIKDSAGTGTIVSVDKTGVQSGSIKLDASTGKITGVTDGLVAAGSKDAVNGGQLDAVKAIANTGWKLTTDKTGTGAVAGNSVEQITPDETVTFIAGDNIAVEQAGNKVTVATKKDVVFDSVTAGGTVINNSGLSFVDGTGTLVANSPSISKTGINAGNQKITNVKAGDVNSTSTDAVNGSQLYTAQNNVKNVLGSSTQIDATGNLTSTNIGGVTGANTVHDAIDKVNSTATNAQTQANKGLNFAVNGVSPADNVQLGETVNFANGTNTTATYDAATNTYKYSLNDTLSLSNAGSLSIKDSAGTGTIVSVDKTGVQSGSIKLDASTGKITGVTDGLVAAGSKEAVNGGQLDAVKAIANTGWKLTTDKTGTGAVAGSSVEQITPDETVTFIAGDNIAVEQAGNKVTVATKKDVVFDRVTSTDILGNTSILSATGIITQDKDGKKSASLSNTGLFVAEMNATGNTLSSSSLEAGKLTVKGTNTLVLDSVKGTLTGLSNKTLGSGDFASQGRAATEEQLNRAQSNVASILGGNAANNGGLLSMSNIGGTGESTIDDAIKSVNQVANNANKGWNVSTNGGTANNVKPNDTVDFSNKDGNVTVSNQGNNITVDLNKDIDLGAAGSVTTGDTKIDNNGLTIAGGPSVTKNGIDAGKQKVTNVADGKITADSQDAVNGGQIHDMMGAGAYDTNGNLSNIGGTGQSNINDAIAAVNKTAVQSKSTVTEGSNIKVVSNSNADGSTNYTVSTADDITLNSVTAKDINAGTVTTDKVVAGNTTVDSSGLSIKNGPSVTASGIDAGSKVVSNVSNGVQNSDAVNMGQLSQYLGGGAGYNNITQSFDAPNYQVNGGSYNNVGDALGALNQADQALGNRITNLGDQLQQAFYSTNQRIDDVEKKANAGIAAAMALENAPYIPGKYTYAAGAAYHGGENAIGLTLRKTADNGRWSLTGGVAAGSSGDPSVRVGISGVID